MTEGQLRAMVREAIARHGGYSPAPMASSRVVVRPHASHVMFDVPAGADADGACVIEPAVACTHCGYCKSYGH